jgi:hypothetical protein
MTQYPAWSDTDTPSRGLPGTAPIPAARTRPPLPPSGAFFWPTRFARFRLWVWRTRHVITGTWFIFTWRLKQRLNRGN